MCSGVEYHVYFPFRIVPTYSLVPITFQILLLDNSVQPIITRYYLYASNYQSYVIDFIFMKAHEESDR